MKRILIGMMALGSISSFANCDYRIDASSMHRGNGLRVPAIEMTEKVLSSKGYKLSYGDNTNYVIAIGAFWKRRSNIAGYSIGRAELKNADGKTIYSAEYSEGLSAGYVLGIGKDSKALRRLKKAVMAMPLCEEL